MRGQEGRRRVILIVAAAALVGVAMTAILYSIGSPSDPGEERQSATKNGPPPLPHWEDPATDDELIVISGDLSDVQNLPGRISRLRIPVTDESGHMIRLFELDAETRPNGWYDATDVQAWFYALSEEGEGASGRAIHLASDEGSILAPNNNPQTGDLRGNVRLALYESEDVYSIDLQTAEPIVVVSTESISFDSTLGRFVTEDAVSVSGSRIELKGRGLMGAVDEAAGRPNFVSIEEYDWIVLRADSTNEDEGASEATPETTGMAPPETERTAPGRTGEPAPPSQDPASSPAWYELTLSDGVRITRGVGEEAIVLTTDSMTAQFGITDEGFESILSARAMSPGSKGPHADGPSPPAAPGVRSVADRLLGLLLAQVDPVESVATPELGPTDVLIEGDGGVTLRALDEQPSQLRTPADLHVLMEGRNVAVDTARGRATGGRLEYFRDAGDLTLSPAPGQGRTVEVELKDLGVLSSPTPLRLALHEPRGGFDGPGVFRAIESPPGRERADAQLPTDLLLSWSESLGLEFAEAAADQTVGALELAAFRGDVRLDDSRGQTLQSGELDLKFNPTEAADEPNLSRLIARDAVQLRSPDGIVDGDELTVDFIQDESGETQPRTAVIAGGVTASDATGRMRCEWMNVDLEIVASANDDERGPSLQVSGLTAHQDVEVEFGDGLVAYCEELIGDPRVETYGLIGSMVRVQGPTIRLLSPGRIDINRAQNTIDAPNEGELLAVLEPSDAGEDSSPNPPPPLIDDPLMTVLEDRLNAGGALIMASAERLSSPSGRDADAVAEWLAASGAQPLRVRWNDSMSYRTLGDAIEIEMSGAVKAETEPAPAEYSRIEGDRVVLTMKEQAPTSDLAAPSADSFASAHDLRRFSVFGSQDSLAQASAGQYTDDTRNQILSLVTLRSTSIDFDALTESLETPAGQLLVVDYREEASSADADGGEPDPDAGLAPAVQLAGRGESLFEWKGHMRLRQTEGEAEMREDVVMTHHPYGSEDRITLTCQELQAAFSIEAITGAEPAAFSFSSGERGMELRSVIANNEVRIESGARTITADTLTYDRAAMIIILQALGDRVVSVTADDGASPFEAKRIRWDLMTDRIRAETISPVQAPDR